MPEGDTLYRIAETLRKVLLNQTITRFETHVDDVEELHGRMPLVGRIVTAVEARGKHLLIVFRVACDICNMSGAEIVSTPDTIRLDLLRTDLVLHTHLAMIGSWHVYRHGEVWRKPHRLSKVVLTTNAFVVPCFNAPTCELMTARSISRHRVLLALGPDAMTDQFDRAEALRRIQRHPKEQIGVVIMQQCEMSGVGNVYKSEVLFIRRISPFTKVGDLTDEGLDELIAESHKLLRLNRARTDRRTRFGLDTRQRLWVYGRTGEPCAVCGTVIRLTRQGLDGRTTYYCPSCQGVVGEALT